MVKMCCKDMMDNTYCTDHDWDYLGNEDKLVYYSSKFDEYGLPVYDGENGSASSYVIIQYCPWCGKKLPKSRRDEWFDCLISMGYEPMEDFDSIPEKYKTSAWYSSKEQ